MEIELEDKIVGRIFIQYQNTEISNPCEFEGQNLYESTYQMF